MPPIISHFYFPQTISAWLMGQRTKKGMEERGEKRNNYAKNKNEFDKQEHFALSSLN